jgi:hypothetical protein
MSALLYLNTLWKHGQQWNFCCCTALLLHLQTFTQHNHVRILDNEFVSFAGNYESPAVMVSQQMAHSLDVCSVLGC